MRILIDADGCPVIEIALKTAKEQHVDCVLFCDTAHRFDKYNVPVVTVSQGADSADFVLVNQIVPGDIVLTQDYGLAAMSLAKGARPMNQDGLLYTPENMDAMLAARHQAAKIRRGGGRLKGPKKRTHQQDVAFQKALEGLLLQCKGTQV